MPKYLIEEQPIVVQPSLVAVFGWTKAALLQQIQFWCDLNQRKNQNFKDGFFWVYNTRNEWAEFLPFILERTVWDTLTELRNENLVIAENHNKSKTNRTLWYRVDHAKLAIILESSTISRSPDVRSYAKPDVRSSTKPDHVYKETDIHTDELVTQKITSRDKASRSKKPKEVKEPKAKPPEEETSKEQAEKEKTPHTLLFEALLISLYGKIEVNLDKGLRARLGKNCKRLLEMECTPVDVRRLMKWLLEDQKMKPAYITSEMLVSRFGVWKASKDAKTENQVTALSIGKYITTGQKVVSIVKIENGMVFLDETAFRDKYEQDPPEQITLEMAQKWQKIA
jgi:hypothetical protein